MWITSLSLNLMFKTKYTFKKTLNYFYIILIDRVHVNLILMSAWS